MDEVRHVVLDEREVVSTEQVLHVGESAREQVVEADDLIPLVQEPSAEV